MADDDTTTETSSDDTEVENERTAPAFTQEDVDRIVNERIRRERTAFANETKELRSKAGKAEQLERERMSETERAVAEATTKAASAARQEVIQEFGSRLVDAKFEAAAAGRTVNGKPIDVPTLLEGVNRAFYLTDDGEADGDKIARFIDGIAPKPDEGEATQRAFPDLGQGRRTQTKSTTGDQFAGAVSSFFR